MPGQAHARSSVGDVPQSDAAPLPCGSAPLKLTGAARAPGAANVISPSEGVHPYPLSSVVLGAVLPSGHKPRSPWPLSALLRQPGALRLLVDRVAGPRSKALQNQDCCGVARLNGGEGAPAPPISRCHLTDATARPLGVGPLGYR